MEDEAKVHTNVSRGSKFLIDLSVLSLAYWLAFLLRFETVIPLQMFKRLMFTWPYVIALQYVFTMAFSVPTLSWTFIGLKEAKRILCALLAANGVLLALRFLSAANLSSWEHLNYALVPLGIIIIDFALCFLGICGVRIFFRLRNENASRDFPPAQHKVRKRTLLIGAGRSGLQVAKEIEERADLGIEPVGFLDDDPLSHGTVLHGLRVLDSIEYLPEVCGKYRIEQALITSSEYDGSMVRRIMQLCTECGVSAKVIPSLYEIVGGTFNLSRIRQVNIEDLLRRAPVRLDSQAVSEQVAGRVVLVTGAGGSIGQELCRQLIRNGPARLVLLERSENGLFEVHRKLAQANPDAELAPVLADVTDQQRMREVFCAFRPHILYHAAAHKHVPMMEWNPGEAIKNNLFGTSAMADLAEEFQLAAFVMISTDKAVNPSSVMGATKRAAEMYLQALAQKSRTRFMTVRFGNVLGSASSVVPIFQEQILQGGPVTVTHPDMLRYFMTIPEATQLVLQAGAMGEGGEVFALDMGKPVRIVDLAKDLIRLSGLSPNDIEIRFTGTRPGEKIEEELWMKPELVARTDHAKIFVTKLEPRVLAEIREHLGLLHAAVARGQPAEILELLKGLVPEFNSASAEPSRVLATETTQAKERADLMNFLDSSAGVEPRQTPKLS